MDSRINIDARETAMDIDEPQVTGYRWESDYEKTWEAIKENEDGLLQPSIEEMILKNKRRRAMMKRNLRLGIMRHIYIIIDFSEAMLQNDLKPNRHTCTLRVVELFLSEFAGLNPISQLGIIITRNKRFEVVSPLSSDMKIHLEKIEKLKHDSCIGEPSLQNSLEAAMKTLKHMPAHTSKEVLIIMGSLTSCDPGDIHATIQSLSSYNIRCSVVGLAAEVKVLKTLVSETKGAYDVVIDDAHFKDLVFEHLKPPPATNETQSTLIRMGFSQYIYDDLKMPSMCACHLSSDTNFSHNGYFCPQCQAKYCDLPVSCHICGLTLVSAAHLARSFHHLFPVDLFEEIKVSNDSSNCFACTKQLKADQNDAAKCKNCSNLFCLDCDIFIHETLHFCPSCSGQSLHKAAVTATASSDGARANCISSASQ